MSIRLGLDFGTATTCIATVPDRSRFEPQVIAFTDGAPFENTAVFLDQSRGQPPIVPSNSACGRAPLALFGEAEVRFAGYWRERIRHQGDGVAWSRWEMDRREEALLLTYFKPELADFPTRRVVRVPEVRFGVYDALSQSDDVQVTFSEREVATPEPDTDDLVAATAAVIRAAAQRAVRVLGGKISMLAVGLPSFSGEGDADEAARARRRREEAVERARIARDFGASDFHLNFVGEAQAAAFALDVQSDKRQVYGIVVDVGAGTTDLALVPYCRDAAGRFSPEEPILTESHRFAGRDLNLALALALKVNHHFRDALSLMDWLDRRAWQLVMDQEVERIKRALTDDERRYVIHMYNVVTHVDGCEVHDERRRLLGRSPDWWLSTRSDVVRNAVGASCKGWRDDIASFLERAAASIGGGEEALASIEVVGGAFKFAPFYHVFLSAVRQAGLSGGKVQYRTAGGEAETAVARGLARWAAVQRAPRR